MGLLKMNHSVDEHVVAPLCEFSASFLDIAESNRLHDSSDRSSTPTLPMCRADEQHASIFGKNKPVVSLDITPAAPTAVPDTPNERLTTVLRERALANNMSPRTSPCCGACVRTLCRANRARLTPRVRLCRRGA